jgi:hypothetical protein
VSSLRFFPRIAIRLGVRSSRAFGLLGHVASARVDTKARGRLSVIVLALGVVVLAGAGAAEKVSATSAGAEHRLGADSDHAFVETDAVGPGASVLARTAVPDDRLVRVLKPVVAAAVLSALTWAFLVRWSTRGAYRFRPGDPISRRAAPRGPPSRLM